MMMSRVFVLLLVWLCVYVSACSPIRVVFLKFHKTGSESTMHFLRDARLFADFAKYWNVRTCRGGNFNHPTLMIYAMRGASGIRSACLLSAPTDGCETEQLYLTTVLRDPLERLSSHMFYFKSLWVSRLRSSFRRVSTAREALDIYNKMHRIPQNITVAEMTLLISTMRSEIPFTVFSNQPTSMTQPYALILGRTIQKPYLPTDASMTEAKRAIREDFGSIGLMEEMPAYYYLLSQHLSIDLRLSCNKNITHLSEMRQPSQLQRARPKAEKLFAPDVVAYLRRHLEPEIELYEYAREIHIQQLANLNHTLETARQTFDAACSNRS